MLACFFVWLWQAQRWLVSTTNTANSPVWNNVFEGTKVPGSVAASCQACEGPVWVSLHLRSRHPSPLHRPNPSEPGTATTSLSSSDQVARTEAAAGGLARQQHKATLKPMTLTSKHGADEPWARDDSLQKARCAQWIMPWHRSDCSNSPEQLPTALASDAAHQKSGLSVPVSQSSKFAVQPSTLAWCAILHSTSNSTATQVCRIGDEGAARMRPQRPLPCDHAGQGVCNTRCCALSPSGLPGPMPGAPSSQRR